MVNLLLKNMFFRMISLTIKVGKIYLYPANYSSVKYNSDI